MLHAPRWARTMSQPVSRAARSCLGLKVPELPILFCIRISQGSCTEIQIEPQWFKASWNFIFPPYLYFWKRWSGGETNLVKLLNSCCVLSKGASQLPTAQVLLKTNGQTLVKAECVCWQGTLLRLVATLEVNLTLFFKPSTFFFFSYSVEWRIILED